MLVIQTLYMWRKKFAYEQMKELFWLGSSLGTTLRNATQVKRASQGFIGQAERTRGPK